MAPSHPKLAEVLAQLETVLRDGAAELEQKPAQHAQLKQLHAELKRMTPGQTPTPRLTALLQQFLGGQLEGEIAQAQQRLAASSQQAGPVALKDTAAHAQVLKALTQARQGLGALDPTRPAPVVEASGVRMANANQAAERALADAEAARVLGPPPPAAPKK
jgi:hypothetical protein